MPSFDLDTMPRRAPPPPPTTAQVDRNTRVPQEPAPRPRTLQDVDNEIARLQAERKQLLARRRAREQDRRCTRIVCKDCEGDGARCYSGWADNMDVEYECCESCDGRGFVLALTWRGAPTSTTQYDFDLDER